MTRYSSSELELGPGCSCGEVHSSWQIPHDLSVDRGGRCPLFPGLDHLFSIAKNGRALQGLSERRRRTPWEETCGDV